MFGFVCIFVFVFVFECVRAAEISQENKKINGLNIFIALTSSVSQWNSIFRNLLCILFVWIQNAAAIQVNMPIEYRTFYDS